MVGCKAADGLFAVSHVKLVGNQQSSALIEAWSQSALTQIRANAELQVEMPNRLLRLSGIDRLQTAQTMGFNDGGGAIKAKLVWLSKGNDVLHIAIYATKLTPEMEETIMESLRWMND